MKEEDWKLNKKRGLEMKKIYLLSVPHLKQPTIIHMLILFSISFKPPLLYVNCTNQRGVCDLV